MYHRQIDNIPLNIPTIFDKREEFKFSIINFPHITSNVPKQLFKAIYISQLFRLSHLNSRRDLFLNRSKILIEKLRFRGYNKKFLEKTYNSFISNHNISFSDGTFMKNCSFPC